MRRQLLPAALLAVAMTASCSPSPAAVTTAIAQTQAAAPTFTPIPTNTQAPSPIGLSSLTPAPTLSPAPTLDACNQSEGRRFYGGLDDSITAMLEKAREIIKLPRTAAAVAYPDLLEMQDGISSLRPPACGEPAHVAGVALAGALADWVSGIITNRDDIETRQAVLDRATDQYVSAMLALAEKLGL